MKNWAMIQNNVILNIIIASDDDIKDDNFLWFDLTNLDPQPGIGWLFDGKKFSNPNPPPTPTPQSYISGVISSAKDFGQGLMSAFAAENVLMGLTEDQMDLCLSTLDPVINAINSGSLKIAIIRINKIIPDQLVVTQARIKKYRNMIEDYLGVPET